MTPGPLVGDFILLFDLDMIETELREVGTATVQFDRPLRPPARMFVFDEDGEAASSDEIDLDAYIARLNAMCAEWGEALTVRFYAFYGEVFDGSEVLAFPEARSLMVNSLSEAENLAPLGALQHVTHIHVGIYGLADKAFLAGLPLERLTSFTLEETKSKAIDLAPLARATALRHLRLFGHKKNIAAVGELSGLEEFAFNPAKGADLTFLNGMTGLRSLKLVLGGTESFVDVSLPGVEEMALTMVRRLTDPGDLGRFSGLNRLILQDQAQLGPITVSEANADLEHLWIFNCPKVTDIEGLEHLPKLKSLFAVKTGMTLEGLSLPGSLEYLWLSSGKARDDDADEAAIKALGLIPETHPDMPFFYK